MQLSGHASLAHHGHVSYSMLLNSVCVYIPLSLVLDYLILAAPSPAGQGTHHRSYIQLGMHIMIVGLDEDTCRQLNRMGMMLCALCNKEGIIPSTLPGYDAPHVALPTTQSPASASGHMERMHLTDDVSEPPHKLGNYICKYSS